MTTARDQKMEEVQQLLKDGVNKIQNSDEFKNYLSVMSKFHNYSFKNVLLIYMQNPNATAVAGFNKWKKDFHRSVKKGEKSIRILAPIMIKNDKAASQTENDKEDSQNDDKKIVGFYPVPVFDISQTVGEELPQAPQPISLQGDYSYYEQSKQILQNLTGYEINEANREDNANGSCNYEHKNIYIKNDLSELQKMKTLLHEVGHALLHGSLFEKDTKDLNLFEIEVMANLSIKEVEAESVSYIVAQFLGFDTSEYSFNYIAGWSGSNEYLEFSVERIRKASNNIIHALENLKLDV